MTWNSYLEKQGLELVPAPSCLLEIWKLNVPTPLKEILWKWTLEALPLGHRFKAAPALGKHCRCGAELTLPHLWRTCPVYNLTPLLEITDNYIKRASTKEMRRTNHPGLICTVPHSSLYWLPLLAPTYLEKSLYAKHTTLSDLLKTKKMRCLTLGKTLWHIWKCRMKEIYCGEMGNQVY
jgi:hypothetical protein